MKFPEQFRMKLPIGHPFRTNEGDTFGAFEIPSRHSCGRSLRIIACNAVAEESQGWEHVSVSLENPEKCPSWAEMALVKDLFWDEEETVIQFHPPKSQYVNRHKGCLHLWRNVNAPTPTPPMELVG